MSATNAKPYALLAEMKSVHDLYEAAHAIKEKGYKRWDVFSPFPIHGMDQAMGLGKSALAWVVFFGGLTGFITAVVLECLPSGALYPLIVQGKPYISLPAFFPIMFELTILLSAFTTVIGLCIFLGLPRWHHPLFNSEEFKRATDDGFFVAIEAVDDNFSETETKKFLEELGATQVTLIKDE